MAGNIILLGAHAQSSLNASLHDLIQMFLEAHYEAPLGARSNTLSLRECRYVSGERDEEKFSMHLNVQVKAPAEGVDVGQLQVTITVKGDGPCLNHYSD